MLLDNGMSVITSAQAASILLRRGTLPRHFSVLEDSDSSLYQQKYQEPVIGAVVDTDIRPQKIYNPEDEESIIDYIISCRRDDISDSEHNDRLEQELTFFLSTDTVSILVSLRKLIETFKNENVVWGVGRGSSCASYVLYLLEVHDINPIKYKIPFKEFSKE